MRKRKGRNKRRKKLIIISSIITLIIAGIIVGGYLFSIRSYDKMEEIDTYTESASDNGSYVRFAKGILRYSRDGIVLFDAKGEELWNHSCQMKTPMIESCGNTAVIGDKGGSDVLVLTRDGVKGEFKTSHPIENLSVSSQGIVAAVLKEDTTPRLICYDAKGTVLVEQRASLTNTGYPMDVEISQNGKILVASYLCVNENAVSTKIVYYNFDEGIEEHQTSEKVYLDTMIPKVEFVDASKVLLVSDKSLIFWEGTKKPEEKQEIKIEKEIKSVACDKENIALVLKNKEDSNYELRVYDMKGKQCLSKNISEEYENLKIVDRQVILYEGTKCQIVTLSGVVRFKGTADVTIDEIYPIVGIDKYMVVGPAGMKKVHLTK